MSSRTRAERHLGDTHHGANGRVFGGNPGGRRWYRSLSWTLGVDCRLAEDSPSWKLSASSPRTRELIKPQASDNEQCVFDNGRATALYLADVC